MLGQIIEHVRHWIAGLMGRRVNGSENIPDIPHIPALPPEEHTNGQAQGQEAAGASEVEPIVVLPPPSAVHIPMEPREPPADALFSSAWIYLDDILEKIPACRQLMIALKNVDRDAYDYFSEVGAKVVPFDNKYVNVERWVRFSTFTDALPARGMVYGLYREDRTVRKEDELWDGIVSYYHKLDKQQPHLWVSDPDAVAVYRITNAYYDCGRDRGYGPKAIKGKIPYGYSYLVSINAAGKMELITERSIDYQQLPVSKNGTQRREHARGGFCRVRWDYPKDIDYHYRDYCRREPKAERLGAKHFATNLFGGIAAIHAETGHEFQVRATRDGITVGFSVALGRTPYFFKDRAIEVNERGNRRRIFHHVEEHQRVYASGKVTTVRAHYRGERHFMWKGEQISIAPPENAEIHFGAPAIEEDMGPTPPDYIDSKTIAHAVTQMYERDHRRQAR